jgi:indole-3-glycerol phosphate synthase
VTILNEILERKRKEVEVAKTRVSAAEMSARARALREPTRGFRQVLMEAEPPAIIAEIKRRSPSRGEIRRDFDPESCARAYSAAGAAAISVLTDEHYFGGHLDYLRRVRECVSLPLLRKDFTLDPYQIDEARVAGADAVLLIVAALDLESLVALRGRARELELDVLVEVHDERELELALQADTDLLGVNNRNLKTFETRLEVTERLAALAPLGEGLVLVAESGISTNHDVNRLQRAGATAFLVGESLMKEPEVGTALTQLRRTP